MTAEEFDFFVRHPGGFDRQFFLEHIVQNMAVFMTQQGIQPEEVEVVGVLETGEELQLVHARPALTWVALHTRDGEVRLVPMSALRQVKIRRRHAPLKPGFTAGPAIEEPTSKQLLPSEST